MWRAGERIGVRTLQAESALSGAFRAEKKTIRVMALAFVVQVVLPDANGQARPQAEKAGYSAMAPFRSLPDA